MTPAASLHQFEGHPVPYVARWTDEVDRRPAQLSMHVETQELMVSYDDGRENRDAFGMLWKREGTTRKGRPEFAQFNTYRQRSCMSRGLCQVCGTKITDRPISWLLPKRALDVTDGIALTDSPPTCEECVPLAKQLCPHLRDPKNAMLLKVLEYSTWGVGGQAVIRDGQSTKTFSAKFQYGVAEVPVTSIVAKRLIVRLDKFVVVEQ